MLLEVVVVTFITVSVGLNAGLLCILCGPRVSAVLKAAPRAYARTPIDDVLDASI